jgi:hypothetical protein
MQTSFFIRKSDSNKRKFLKHTRSKSNTSKNKALEIVTNEYNLSMKILSEEHDSFFKELKEIYEEGEKLKRKFDLDFSNMKLDFSNMSLEEWERKWDSYYESQFQYSIKLYTRFKDFFENRKRNCIGINRDFDKQIEIFNSFIEPLYSTNNWNSFYISNPSTTT